MMSETVFYWEVVELEGAVWVLGNILAIGLESAMAEGCLPLLFYLPSVQDIIYWHSKNWNLPFSDY